MEKVLIIDWDNYLSRLFFTNKVIIWKDKEENDIIDTYETIQKTLKTLSYFNNLINFKTYTKIIFAFDTKTWKESNSRILSEINKKYNIDSAWYKWKRDKRPEFDEYKKILQNLIYFQWFEIYTSHTHEADDVIATIVEKHKNDNNVHYIDILSRDNDMLQLLDTNVFIVYWLSQKDLKEKVSVWTLKLKYLTKFNLKINNPSDIIIIKAIAGDKSDNIVWVKWIAEKTLANDLEGKNDIKESSIYIKHKEYIDEVAKVIELNKNINDDELKHLKIDYNVELFNWYLNKLSLEKDLTKKEIKIDDIKN